MNNLYKAITLRIVLADLKELDRQFSNPQKEGTSLMFFLSIKNALIIVSNFVDEELKLRYLYKENRDLSQIFKKEEKAYTFTKYLRNKFAGHISSELIEKAIEWRPDIRLGLDQLDNQEVMYITNLYVLETAINSYVDENQKNKYFPFNNFDFIYPPDYEEFLKFLTIIIRNSIEYLETTLKVLDISNYQLSTTSPKSIMHWVKAAETEFKFLKK